jgi:hypothetical protein
MKHALKNTRIYVADKQKRIISRRRRRLIQTHLYNVFFLLEVGFYFSIYHLSPKPLILGMPLPWGLTTHLKFP